MFTDKKVEAIIREEKLVDVKDSLDRLGHRGMTVSGVQGHGRQNGAKERLREEEYQRNLLPKLKVEVVTTDEQARKIAEEIVTEAESGEAGDGKVFITPVEEAIRVRTGETGEEAL